MKVNTFNVIDSTVKKIIVEINGKITDMAFYFEPKEQRYIILHNFSNRFFKDDVFASKISNILYNELDKQGIHNYDFYEDEFALSILSMEYKEHYPNRKKQNLFINIDENQFTIYPCNQEFHIGLNNSKFQLSA